MLKVHVHVMSHVKVWGGREESIECHGRNSRDIRRACGKDEVWCGPTIETAVTAILSVSMLLPASSRYGCPPLPSQARDSDDGLPAFVRNSEIPADRYWMKLTFSLMYTGIRGAFFAES